ncbi:MAG: CNNM domain-containing protein [Planctomycetota bacterium]
MSPWIDVALVLLGLLGTAIYECSETAFYCVSRARIDVEARQGHRTSKIIRRLLQQDTAFLISVLIGTNLMLEMLTWSAEDLLRGLGWPDWGVRTALLGILTPLVFFLCEILPKDLARRRPHALLSFTAPLALVSRYLFWPLERLLYVLTLALTRLAGFEPRLLSIVRGREAVLRLLSEGASEGAILPHAELMARNVLKLRSIAVERCMIPWKSVQTLRLVAPGSDAAGSYELVARSPFTRVPVEDEKGAVLGYVHQLDVLSEGEGTPVVEHLRPAMFLPSGTSVDKALARLRGGGQRLAIVGEAERPEGLVTLKDLLEEISGDLAGW